ASRQCERGLVRTGAATISPAGHGGKVSFLIVVAFDTAALAAKYDGRGIGAACHVELAPDREQILVHPRFADSKVGRDLLGRPAVPETFETFQLKVGELGGDRL